MVLNLSLVEVWGWGGQLCFLLIEGICGPDGGGGCVPKSFRQALSTEHFLKQILLLPCVHPPTASARVHFMFEELHPSWRTWFYFWCILRSPEETLSFPNRPSQISLRG